MGIASVLEIMMSEWGVKPKEVLEGWTMSEVLVYLEALKVRRERENRAGEGGGKEVGVEEKGSLVVGDRVKKMLEEGERREGEGRVGKSGVYVKVG